MNATDAVVVWIKLEVEGADADALAAVVVEALLDEGTPQDDINDSGYDLRVTSATVHPDPVSP